MPTKLPSFEVMADLARTDPPAFEAMRKKLIRDAIAQVRNDVRRRRLQGLQFQIDMELRKAANPMAGCIRISQMMSESLLELHQALNGASTTSNNSLPARTNTDGATILDFPDHQRQTCTTGCNED